MPLSGTARRRLCLLAAIAATIAAGLASRQFPWLLPAWLGKFPGDALWALMVYLGLALLAPRARPWPLAAVALAACWLVEASQLYRAPWLDALRATTLGHLALGSTFVWMDLLAYAAGVAAGAARAARRGAAMSAAQDPRHTITGALGAGFLAQGLALRRGRAFEKAAASGALYRYDVDLPGERAGTRRIRPGTCAIRHR